MPLCEKYKRNIFYYGARLWNQIPVKERRIDKYKEFKHVQKVKALQNRIYYLNDINNINSKGDIYI